MIPVFQVLREFVLTLFYPLAHLIPLPSESNPKNPKKTFVFVERWFHANPFHKVWMHYLRKQGFAVYGINFPIYEGSFEQSAQKLQTYLQEKNLTHIILVGISAGGVTGLLYLQHFGGWERVDKFVTLGAPLRGTPMAFLISFLFSGRELLPGSSTVEKMTKESLRNPDKITTISPRFDEMVPLSHSYLPHTKHIILKVIGHNNFHLDSRKTYQELIKIAGN